ncbi:MAG TPA: acyltransferase [Flavobacterium sp.]|nr:acyltransferase [Flavobacterium sp.]
MFYKFYEYFQKKIRYLEAKNLKDKLKYCGNNVCLGNSISIDFPEKVSLGDNVCIGRNTSLQSKGGIEIGEGAIISFNVIILSANHDFLSAIPFGDGYIEKFTYVGKKVWVGCGVIILPGIRIGEGAIIGAGTIVTKDINPYEIVVNEISLKILKVRK